MSIEFKAFEMHSHTLHSDGSFTVEELCHHAKKRELDGIALTDHNTFSGHLEATTQLQKETLPVIKAIEWTTFFGHMLVIGADEYVDWRFATPHTIDESIEKIKNANGAVGIAHPFALGNPMCTGCRWDFKVTKWENVDYIEVWSGAFPLIDKESAPINKQAFQMWTDLLNQGYQIAASNGRDWHGPDQDQKHMAATYLGVENGIVTTETVRTALREKRTYVTSGPALDFQIIQNAKKYTIGDTVNPDVCQINFSIDTNARSAQWKEFGIIPKEVQIVQNGFPIIKRPIHTNLNGVMEATLWPGWVRLEVLGEYIGTDNQLLAFTSPIYINRF